MTKDICEMKPCPFCGGELDPSTTTFKLCGNCYASFEVDDDLWNAPRHYEAHGGRLDASQSKPPQGERVLLWLRYESCPVVGYWGTGEWEACTVNLKTECDSFCMGGQPDRDFKNGDVLFYAHINEFPEEPA